MVGDLNDFIRDKEALALGIIPRAGILWHHGLNTLEIAKRIGVTEAEVYNRMALIKQWVKDHRA